LIVANILTATGRRLFWPVPRWRAVQEKLFLRHVAHAGRTEFYRRRLAGEKIRRLADITALPLSDKHQLSAAGEAAFGCSPQEIREWVTTSGTMGKPLRVPLTKGDLNRLAENEAAALGIAGLAAGDNLIIAVGMDRLFVAGLAYWLGAQRLGAACWRVGTPHVAQPELLCSLLDAGRRNFLITVPSLLVHCPPPADRRVYHALAAIIGIGEPLRAADGSANALAKRLATNFGVPVLSTYASTETCATFAEGPVCRGGHLNPALAVVEIIDAQGRPIDAGRVGEVVITPLGVEGLPLLRFRTGDMAALYTEPCPCGRTTPRLGPIVGRREQLLKVRGASLFPAAIFDVLHSLPEIRDYVVVVRRRHELSDVVTIHVQWERDAQAGRERLQQKARAWLKISPRIVSASALELKALRLSSGSRKPPKFLDLRPTTSAEDRRAAASR
jgi:phenylacetate-CoA ligase